MSTCEACNRIPAVVVEGYKEKGNWIQFSELKVCPYPCTHTHLYPNSNTEPDVTGNQASAKAIVDVYDIFGAAPQTLQGADLIAAALDVLVLVPDFFKGSPMQNEWLANPTEENVKAKDDFRKGMAEFGRHVVTLLGVVKEAKGKWENVTSWGVLGLCWGGKASFLLEDGIKCSCSWTE